MQEQLEAGEQGKEGDPEFEISLESDDPQQGAAGDSNGDGNDGEAEAEDAVSRAAEEIAEALAEKFEEELAPVVESMEAAMEHFGDLDELLQGRKGWDLSQGVWQKSGWREFQSLRKKLEKLRELRDLVGAAVLCQCWSSSCGAYAQREPVGELGGVQVRSLGRGGGKGPLRRAPEEVYAPRRLPGVIRSPLVPEEVQGLHKSGSLTQMLPAEAALMAVGWPRRAAGDRVGRSTQHGDMESEEDSTGSDAEQRGSHPARLLFMARLAEKSLMSYERAGTPCAVCCVTRVWCWPFHRVVGCLGSPQGGCACTLH